MSFATWWGTPMFWRGQTYFMLCVHMTGLLNLWFRVIFNFSFYSIHNSVENIPNIFTLLMSAVDSTIFPLLHFQHLEECQVLINRRSINVLNEYINYWITYLCMEVWIYEYAYTHTHKFGEFKKGEGRECTCFKHQLCASLCLRSLDIPSFA